MFDLFGSKKKSYLASPIFQQQLSFAKDFKSIVRGMSTSSCLINISPSKNASKTYFCLTFSTLIVNDTLKSKLDSYALIYQTVHRDPPFEKIFLDGIQQSLFNSPKNLALFKKYENSKHLNISTILSEGFYLPEYCGIPYTSPSDDIYHFSYTLGFDTMWADKRYESTHVSSDELDYYIEIFREELNKF